MTKDDAQNPNPANSTAVTEGQARDLNMEPGRGARQEPGADMSQDTLEQNVDTGNTKYTALDTETQE